MKHILPKRAAVMVGCAVVCIAASSARAANEETQRKVRFNEGIVAFTQDDFTRAERIFAQLVREDDTDVGALYWLGLCQLQRNKYTAAAESFDKVLKLAPERLEVKLDAAIALVGRDMFEEGRGRLQEFVEAGLGDAHTRALAQFFLGVAEYKLGNYDQALQAIEAAEEGTEDPTMLANIAWYRSWCYAEKGEFEQAEKEFRRVSELSTNVDQQARALTLAEQVKTGTVEAEPVSQFQFRLDLGFTHDTNVVLLGDDTSLPISLSTDDDFRFGLGTDARYLYPLNEKWLLGVGASTYHSWHASLQEFNVQSYGGRLFLNYFMNDDTTLGLQYEYDFSLVNNDAFLSRHRLTPSLRYVEAYHDDGTPLTSTTLFYSYENRNYHEELTDMRQDRDGDYHTLGLVQSLNLCQPWIEEGDERWVSAALGYRWQTESTHGDDFDLSGHALSARIDLPLPYELIFGFSGRWAWEDYWQPNSQDARRREREDFIQQYVWSLSREFELDRNITLAVRAEIAWTEDDSNVRNQLTEAIYSYDRVLYGLTFSFLFR